MNDLKPLHKTIIAIVFLATLAVLQWKGQDTATFIVVGLMLLGISGYSVGKIEAVQKQTNGGQEKLIQALTENTRQQMEVLRIVASLPPAPVQSTEEKSFIEGEYHHAEESLAQSR